MAKEKVQRQHSNCICSAMKNASRIASKAPVEKNGKTKLNRGEGVGKFVISINSLVEVSICFKELNFCD